VFYIELPFCVKYFSLTTLVSSVVNGFFVSTDTQPRCSPLTIEVRDALRVWVKQSPDPVWVSLIIFKNHHKYHKKTPIYFLAISSQCWIKSQRPTKSVIPKGVPHYNTLPKGGPPNFRFPLSKLFLIPFDYKIYCGCP